MIRCISCHYRIQSSLLWAVFHEAALALTLLLQLLHGLLDGIVDEEQGEEAILGLDDFEEVVFQGQQDLREETGDLRADELVKLQFLRLNKPRRYLLLLIAPRQFCGVVPDQLRKLLVHELHLLGLAGFDALGLLLQQLVLLSVALVPWPADALLLLVEVLKRC